jgi:hypothetical protein
MFKYFRLKRKNTKNVEPSLTLPHRMCFFYLSIPFPLFIIFVLPVASVYVIKRKNIDLAVRNMTKKYHIIPWFE